MGVSSPRKRWRRTTGACGNQRSTARARRSGRQASRRGRWPEQSGAPSDGYRSVDVPADRIGDTAAIRKGVASALRIGVRDIDDDAHAWVEVGEFCLDDQRIFAAFQTLESAATVAQEFAR